jgi:type 2 lantibiotic biosynthesis protein LanM
VTIAAPPASLEERVGLIVANALTLDERIAAGRHPARPWDAARRGEMLDAWRQACAGGDEALFRERLAWDGLTPEGASALMGDLPSLERPQWPDWGHCLLDVLEDRRAEAPSPAGPGRDSLPFGEIVRPFVAVLNRRLAPVLATLDGLVEPAAFGALGLQTSREISTLLTPVLMREFQLFRAPLLAGTIPLPTSRLAYDPFVSSLAGDGLVAVLLRYPVLGRLIGTLCLHWQEFVAEFAGRLLRDRDDLAAIFGLKGGDRITGLGLGLSDRHRRGRVCVRLDFPGGRSLFYKPKSLEPDLVFYAFLRHLAELTGAPAPLCPETWDRGAYGWVEGVAPRPCADEGEVRRFYEAAGQLLFAQYLAGGSDVHYENLIAAGPHPVLIDHECLMSNRPGLREPAPTAMEQAQTDFFLHSVMRVGMLPHWRGGGDHPPSDSSALGRIAAGGGSYAALDVKYPNSDVMRFQRVVPDGQAGGNVVRLEGAAVEPSGYLDALTGGFERSYRAYMAQGPGDPHADALSRLTTRYLARDTQLYAQFSVRLRLPSALCDGISAQIALEGLCRGMLLDTEFGKPMQPIARQEVAALMRLDVPVFHVRAGSRDVLLEDGTPAEGVFSSTAAATLASRCRRLGEADLLRQKRLIAASFAGRTAAPTRSARTRAGGDLEAPGALEEASMAAARAIARQIRDQAIAGADGSLTWISVIQKQATGTWHTVPMQPHLYDGASGTALFLAAYARAGGDTSYAEAALAALAPLLDSGDLSATVRLLNKPGIGAGIGAGSAIYALVRIAGLLDRPALLDCAEGLAAELTGREIDADRRFDLMDGAAGLLVALLALHTERPSDRLKALARRCGDHLLAGAVAQERAGLAWPAADGTVRTGFIHGASGIAVALARAAEALGRPDYARAAEEALAFERRGGDAWSRQRFTCDPAPEPQPLCSWCNGAPSIAVARLELSRFAFLDRTGLASDMRTACDIAAGQPHQPIDHLCCGNLGRAAVLRRAGGATGREDLARRARTIVADTLREWRDSGRFELGWAGLESPSFHQGLAGIGYELLRVAGHGDLPDVLGFA